MRGLWKSPGGLEVPQVVTVAEEQLPDLDLPQEAETGATEPGGGWDETIGSAQNSVLHTITEDDAVVENLRVYGQIRVNANRVIVRNCHVSDDADEFPAQPLIWEFQGSGGQCIGNTVVGTPGSDPSAAGVSGFDYVAKNHISKCADGIKVGSSMLVELNWIELMQWGEHNGQPTHCDGIQGQAGTALEIRYNVLIGPLVDGGSEDSVGDMNSALNGGIFLKSDSGNIDAHVHHNSVRGFATNGYFYQTGSSTVKVNVHDNIFGSGDEALFVALREVNGVDGTYTNNVDQDSEAVEPS